MSVNPYRQYILGCKRKYGTARSQVKYKELIQAYLRLKRQQARKG